MNSKPADRSDFQSGRSDGSEIKQRTRVAPRPADGSSAGGATSRVSHGTGGAAPDPNMTIVKSPEQLTWVDMFNSGEGAKIYAAGGKIVSTANLYGETSKPGIYYVLIKWYPGFMSAPHWYETDRLCVVVSGTWWVTSGETFDPDSTVPAPAGTFVRRVAKTPHYDGVKSDGKEPATIAICGMVPITAHWLEADKPGWRKA